MSVQSDGPGLASRRVSLGSIASDATTDSDAHSSSRTSRSSSDSYASSSSHVEAQASLVVVATTAATSRRSSLDVPPVRERSILPSTSRSLPGTPPPAPLRRIIRPKMAASNSSSAIATVVTDLPVEAVPFSVKKPTRHVEAATPTSAPLSQQQPPLPPPPQPQRQQQDSHLASRGLSSMPASIRARYSSSIACRHAVLAHSIFQSKSLARAKREALSTGGAVSVVVADPLQPARRLKERMELAAAQHAAAPPTPSAALGPPLAQPPTASSFRAPQANGLTHVVTMRTDSLNQHGRPQAHMPPSYSTLTPPPPPPPSPPIHLSLSEIHQQLLRLTPAEQFRLLQQFQTSTTPTVEPAQTNSYTPSQGMASTTQTFAQRQPQQPPPQLPSSLVSTAATVAPALHYHPYPTVASSSIPLARRPFVPPPAARSDAVVTAGTYEMASTPVGVSVAASSVPPGAASAHPTFPPALPGQRLLPRSNGPTGSFPSSINLAFHRPYSTAAAYARKRQQQQQQVHRAPLGAVAVAALQLPPQQPIVATVASQPLVHRLMKLEAPIERQIV